MQLLETRRQAMTQAHQAERQKLDEAQKRRWDAEALERSQRLNKGLRGLWDRLTGRHAEAQRRNLAGAADALWRDREQRQALVEAQLADRRNLLTEIAAERTRHAALLREVRVDGAPYRSKLDRSERPLDAKAEIAEPARRPLSPAQSPTLREPFTDAARAEAPRKGLKERLEQIRSREPRRDRGQDLER
jgi:hypothetical protein